MLLFNVEEFFKGTIAPSDDMPRGISKIFLPEPVVQGIQFHRF